MANNWTTIDTAIKVWLDGHAASLTWYRGDQDIPRPALPCGQWTWHDTAMRLPAQGNAPDDDPTRAVAPTSTLRQVVQQRRHRLEIQLYASATTGNATASALAEVLANSLALNSVQDAFTAAGFVARADGSVIDATALLGYAAESRAVIEVLITTAASLTEEVGRIETVTPLTGTITT